MLGQGFDHARLEQSGSNYKTYENGDHSAGHTDRYRKRRGRRNLRQEWKNNILDRTLSFPLLSSFLRQISLLTPRRVVLRRQIYNVPSWLRIPVCHMRAVAGVPSLEATG